MWTVPGKNFLFSFNKLVLDMPKAANPEVDWFGAVVHHACLNCSRGKTKLTYNQHFCSTL